MKKLFFLLLFVWLSTTLTAADPMFMKGDTYINLGVGLNWFPVADINIDHCVLDGIGKGSIGAGGYAGIGFESGSYKHYFAGARGTFHYPVIEDFDTYIGGSMGLCFDRDPWGNYGPYFITGLFIGANYPISKNLILFGEVGSGIAHLHGGLTFFF